MFNRSRESFRYSIILSVWTERLIYKVVKGNIPDHLIKMLTNIITEKKFYTALEEHTSDLILNLEKRLTTGNCTSPGPI